MVARRFGEEGDTRQLSKLGTAVSRASISYAFTERGARLLSPHTFTCFARSKARIASFAVPFAAREPPVPPPRAEPGRLCARRNSRWRRRRRRSPARLHQPRTTRGARAGPPRSLPARWRARRTRLARTGSLGAPRCRQAPPRTPPRRSRWQTRRRGMEQATAQTPEAQRRGRLLNRALRWWQRSRLRAAAAAAKTTSAEGSERTGCAGGVGSVALRAPAGQPRTGTSTGPPRRRR